MTPGQEKREQLLLQLHDLFERAPDKEKARELVLAAFQLEREALMHVVHRQIHSSHFMRVRQRIIEDGNKRDATWKNV